MREILFMEPVFKEMIWGGDRLAKEYGYNIPSDKTGECWAVSAHPDGDCRIASGSLKGERLSSLFEKHSELFAGVSGEVFPLLIKIIDAKNDLSIQVHPDDEYAHIHENGALGKTECWYVLDCDPDATIVIGHNARNKDELREMIHDNRWKDLIDIRPVKKGDFFQIEPGTVHAIRKGTLILETQQNSAITYRLYDYDRLDNGKPRELHIDKSIDVIRCPHTDVLADGTVNQLSEGCSVTELITCRYYGVRKVDLQGSYTFEQNEPFTIISVIEGEGKVDGSPVKKGDHFILPHGYGSYQAEGNLSLIVSYIPS